MAEDKRYSIISVEDDDLVIQAGAVPGASRDAEDASEDAGESLAEQGGTPVRQGAVEPAAEQTSAHFEDAAWSDGAHAASPGSEPSAEERRRRARAAARAEELERLRETERQLQAKPEQARMHKVVLALFALLVVVFAVCYYLFFMA